VEDNIGNVEKSCEVEIGGKKIIFATGKLTKQTNGSVMVRSGSSGVLVTAVMSENPREGLDFFPLVVDIEERMYAAGKIPGGFFKREGRASDKAILIARITDRSLRPLFDKNIRNEVQVIGTIVSVDQVSPYDVLILNGASMALYISDIPFDDPIAAVRVSKVDEKWVFNPTYEEIGKSIIDIVIAGTENAILMVEAGGKEASEDVVIEAIEMAHPEIKKIINIQKEFKEKVGKKKKEVTKFELNKEVAEKVKELASAKIQKVIDSIVKHANEGSMEQLLGVSDKGYLQDEVQIIKKEVIEAVEEEFPEDRESIIVSLKEIERELVREMVLSKKIRPDGRKTDEIRKVSCEVGLFPDTTHGTGLFTRGRTQALTVLALGSIKEAQRIDSLEVEEFKRFIHHYNFPPYATGETGFMRGPKRREIGHGALAERALKPVIPEESKFPYSLRLVSEILESNGSSSMASVCGSTLALMDAGVPISNPVSGIAMGLIKGSDDDLVVLSDIQGVEDFYGDMDFKVAGTKNGITALQMDIKIKGINIDILKEALHRAYEGRMYILGKMFETIQEPREHLSKSAPKITIFKIPREKIGEVIGPGGRNVKSIKEEFKLDEIEIYDFEGSGMVSITSSDDKNTELAKKRIEAVLKDIDDIEEGEEFLGTVVGITKFGAFINLIPGLDGLLHISKISDKRISRVEDVLNLGDKIMVKVSSIDKRAKKIALERVDI
jgi:polyribonucleotide nucleotidyltransferase